jgi:hypothetical protein
MRSTIRFSISVFSLSCLLKGLLASIGLDYRVFHAVDPLYEVGAEWSASAMGYFSPGGVGWEGIPSPLARLAFWVVFLGVFGAETAVGATIARWLVMRTGSRA